MVDSVMHPFEPIYNNESRVLVLGTMPSPKSRERSFFYAHPQNRFWPVMARVLGGELPESNEDRAQMLLEHGIALWDVLASCDISGASDASIRNPVPNDLRRIVDAAPIQHVFATGTTAARLYRRLVEPALGMPITQLPSTSPANARWKLDDLVRAYKAIVDCMT